MQFSRNIPAFGDGVETKDRIALRFRVCEFPAVDGINDRARIRQFDALLDTTAATAPACVHEPDPALVLLYFSGQEFWYFFS